MKLQSRSFMSCNKSLVHRLAPLSCMVHAFEVDERDS